MKSNELKPFTELSHTDKLLRLDWFGGVTSNLDEHDNPLVECVFTPFEWAKDSNGKKTLKRNISTQFIASIAVGYLPVLQIGQYFKNENWAPRENWLDAETITFDLEVSNSEFVVECTLPDIDLSPSSNFINPHYQNTANKSGIKKLNGILRHSSNLTIKRKNVPQDVFIHEMELIRFYLTVSSRSCLKIFTGAFSEAKIQTCVKNELHEKAFLDPQTGAGRFVYRHGYYEKDAPILGRILLDPKGIALKAAQRVNSKIVADRINSEPNGLGYPRTYFPFTGTTRLVLSGRRVKTNTGFIFFAYRIHSCNAPFPYKSLSYCDEIAPGGAPAPEGAPDAFAGSKPPEIGPAHEPGNHGNSTSSEPPSATSVPLEIELSERHYPGLSGVPIFKEKLRDCTHGSGKKPPKYVDDLRNASTGGGTSGKSSAIRQSVAEEIIIPSPITPDLVTFIAVIQGLRKLKANWTVDTIIVDSVPGNVLESNGEQISYFPKVACEKFTSINRQFSFTDDEKKVRRRFICAQVVVNDQYIYLFEAERRLRFPISPEAPSTYKEILPILLLRKPNYGQVDAPDFVPMIELTVRNKTWPDENNVGGLVKAYTVHGKGVQTVDEMCARVAKLIGRNVSKV